MSKITKEFIEEEIQEYEEINQLTEVELLKQELEFAKQEIETTKEKLKRKNNVLDIKFEDIRIPVGFYPPFPMKIFSKYDFFYKNRYWRDSDCIYVDKHNNLISGYSTYLVAQMFGYQIPEAYDVEIRLGYKDYENTKKYGKHEKFTNY